jgi:hypothetical protein
MSFGGHSYPKELAQCGIVWFARLALDVFKILREPESQNFEHAVKRVVRVPYRYKCLWSIEIVPVLEIRGRFEEL